MPPFPPVGLNAGSDRLVPESGRKTSESAARGRAWPFCHHPAGQRPMAMKLPIAGMVRIAVAASQIQSDVTVESSPAPM